MLEGRAYGTFLVKQNRVTRELINCHQIPIYALLLETPIVSLLGRALLFNLR